MMPSIILKLIIYLLESLFGLLGILIDLFPIESYLKFLYSFI